MTWELKRETHFSKSMWSLSSTALRFVKNLYSWSDSPKSRFGLYTRRFEFTFRNLSFGKNIPKKTMSNNLAKICHATDYVEKYLVRRKGRSLIFHFPKETWLSKQCAFPLMTFRKPAGTPKEAELSPHVCLANLQELNAQTTVHASDARILARVDIVLTKTRQITRELIALQQQATCLAQTQTGSPHQVMTLCCRSLTWQAVLNTLLYKLYILKRSQCRHCISPYMMVHLKGLLRIPLTHVSKELQRHNAALFLPSLWTLFNSDALCIWLK